MKKLTALLIACMSISCLFASCGSSGDDDDDKEKKTTAAYELNDDEDDYSGYDKDSKTDKDDNEDENEVENKTETKTDEEDIPTLDLNNESSADDLIGVWDFQTSTESGGWIFEANGTGSMYLDVTEAFYTSGNSFFFEDTEISEEYIDYDGEILSINADGNNILTMIRTDSPDSSSYDGEYYLSSGLYYDIMAEQFGNVEMSVILDNEKSLMIFYDLFKYEVNGDSLTITSYKIELPDNIQTTTKFRVQGNKLIFTNSDGTSETYTRHANVN